MKLVKTFMITLSVSFITTFICIELSETTIRKTQTNYSLTKNNVRFVKFGNRNKNNETGDFAAAALVSNAVVHVKGKSKVYNTQTGYSVGNSIGSGVIINNNGFVVTNNHVIKNTSDITVTLPNRKKYDAILIGTDPESDLAVLKINEHNLPFISFANSDMVKVGEWVLAIGYPWNLDETITAGIISAKPVTSDRVATVYPVSSYIQTDAAINLGNSGGALVNTSGELIGINTALISPTATYTGYGYAIPANTVNRVVQNILKKAHQAKISI